MDKTRTVPYKLEILPFEGSVIYCSTYSGTERWYMATSLSEIVFDTDKNAYVPKNPHSKCVELHSSLFDLSRFKQEDVLTDQPILNAWEYSNEEWKRAVAYLGKSELEEGGFKKSAIITDEIPEVVYVRDDGKIYR